MEHGYREDLMAELAARDIPFIVIGLNVLETAMARDVLALAGAVGNDNDADSLFRACALPKFDVDADELRKKLAVASGQKSFKAVLHTLDSAAPVLAAIKEARAFVREQELGAEGALTYLVRQFGLPEQDAVVQAILRFAAAWKKKAFVKDSSLPEFLQYLDYYQKGRGIIPLFTEEQMGNWSAAILMRCS